jgi:hypothetical protein
VSEQDIKSDTTILTTREVSVLKELMFARLDGIEKSIEVAHDDLVRVPTDVQKQVGALKELHQQIFETVNVKFSGVATRFTERDERFNERFMASQEALAAAFAAQKEATGKIEVSFTKQLDSCNEKISYNKERIATLEGNVSSLLSQKSESRASNSEQRSSIALIATIVFSALAFILGILNYLNK